MQFLEVGKSEELVKMVNLMSLQLFLKVQSSFTSKLMKGNFALLSTKRKFGMLILLWICNQFCI